MLTTCIDAYSSLCCGYSLTWEGGMYSLRNLMINVVIDKVEWCEKHGIIINKSEWNNSQLSGVLVTDMGSIGETKICISRINQRTLNNW